MAGPDVDIVITEIGGTVGDIESLPFLEAARQVRHDVGRDNCFFLHVSLVPYIGPSGELKTKPTQHSVAALRSIGIAPDAVVCRADREIPDSVKRKISLMCDVDDEAVVAAVDAPSIYDIPKVLHSRGSRRLRRTPAQPAVPRRRLDPLGPAAAARPPPRRGGHGRAGRQVHRPARRLPVGRGGAARRRLRHTRAGQPALGRLRRVRRPPRVRPRTSPTSTRSACPAGSASAASRARSARCSYAREHGIPTLGLCLGLQCMVIEFARNVAGLTEAGSTEFDADASRAGDRHDGGAARHRRRARVTWAARCGWGSTRPTSTPGSVVAEAYGAGQVEERHRHRYEVNNKFRGDLEAAGLVFSGLSPDRELVEFVELPRDVHPYYVATQAHPELRSRPTRPHPLFSGLVARRDRAAARAAAPGRRERSAARPRARAAE